MVDGVQGNRNDGVVPNLVNVLANANEKDLISERSIFLELDKDRNGEITNKEIKDAENELNNLKDFAQEKGWSELLNKAIENLKNLAPSFMKKQADYANGHMAITTFSEYQLVDMPEVGTKQGLGNVSEQHYTTDKDGDGKVDDTSRYMFSDFVSQTGHEITTSYYTRDKDGDGEADVVKYNQAIYRDGKIVSENKWEKK